MANKKQASIIAKQNQKLKKAKIDITGLDLKSVQARADLVREILNEVGIKEGKGEWHSQLSIAYQMVMGVIDPPSVRKLTEEEYEIFHAAMYNAASIAPSLTDYISLLHPMISKSISTLGTDKWFRVVIGYWFFDPSLSSMERGTLLVHEVMHNVLGHCDMEGLDAALVNMAGDAIINQGIEAAGSKMLLPSNPDGSDFGFYPRSIKTEEHPNGMANNLSFYDYYYALKAQQEKNEDTARSQSNGGNTAESSDGRVQSPSQSSPDGDGSSSGSSQPQSNTNSDQTSECGNGSSSGGGDDRSSSRGKNDGGTGNPEEYPIKPSDMCRPMSKEDQESLEQEDIEKATSLDKEMARAGAIAKAMECSKDKTYGKSGSFFDQFILDALRPPTVPWSKVLRGIVSRQFNTIVTGGMDYSFKRPSRRSAPGGFIRPSFIAYAPKVLVGCDCSGSMSNEDYESAVSEVEGIFKSMDCGSLDFVTVDTQITSKQVVKSAKELKLVGGGGTEMSPLLDYVNALSPVNRPDVVVLCTDGWFDWTSYLDRINGKLFYVVLVTDRSGYERSKQYENTYSNLKILPIFKDRD